MKPVQSHDYDAGEQLKKPKEAIMNNEPAPGYDAAFPHGETPWLEPHPGMSKRFYAAVHIAVSLAETYRKSIVGEEEAKEIAEESFLIADALIKAEGGNNEQ